MGCRQAVRHGTLTPAFVGSNPAIPARKKHLPRQVLFSVKFVPAERVKYADACEIAYGSEMRFAREENEFHFTSNEVRYFTISARKLFHIRHKPNISLNFPTLKFFEILQMHFGHFGSVDRFEPAREPFSLTERTDSKNALLICVVPCAIIYPSSAWQIMFV